MTKIIFISIISENMDISERIYNQLESEGWVFRNQTHIHSVGVLLEMQRKISLIINKKEQ
ncbi:MAG: hypothetical protein OEL54_01695, partial [Flavobacteriaceae bacterium]|nr:hypothetical protein [Flavobacteriaceae bacterium]